ADALVIDAFTNTGTNTYSLSDTSANLSAAPSALIAGATQVIPTDAVTVAEAVALLAINANAVYSLFDSAANLADAPAGVGDGAIFVTTTDLASVAQAT